MTTFKKILIYLAATGIVIIFGSNLIMLVTTRKYIAKNINSITNSETGIILGASVYKDQVSVIVKDRIDTMVELYQAGKVKKILISGDKTERFYNEVETIKIWLNRNKIPDKDILMDFSGFSTYESIFRAHNRFNVGRTVIVSQKYHLPRAVYIARSKGMDAQGLCADHVTYQNLPWYEFREIFARLKDYFYVHLLKPNPE